MNSFDFWFVAIPTVGFVIAAILHRKINGQFLPYFIKPFRDDREDEDKFNIDHHVDVSNTRPNPPAWKEEIRKLLKDSGKDSDYFIAQAAFSRLEEIMKMD